MTTSVTAHQEDAQVPVPVINAPACQHFFAVWQDWRGDQLVPRRADCRIRDVAPLLPGVTILDAVSPQDFRFRLVGTVIDERSAQRLTSANLLDMTTPDERPVRAARLWGMASQPCGSTARFNKIYLNGVETPLESLTLPVQPDADDAPMQLFTVLAIPDLSLEVVDIARMPTLRITPDFDFIDIGAGLPTLAAGVA
jgi:hypothetical protein